MLSSGLVYGSHSIFFHKMLKLVLVVLCNLCIWGECLWVIISCMYRCTVGEWTPYLGPSFFVSFLMLSLYVYESDERAVSYKWIKHIVFEQLAITDISDSVCV